MDEKKSETSRAKRHRITVLDVLEQSLKRLHNACKLAERQAHQAAFPITPPVVPQLSDKDAWERLRVELVTADDLASAIKKDRTVVSRRLQDKGILPVYYLGKIPLYLPSVKRELTAETTHAASLARYGDLPTRKCAC